MANPTSAADLGLTYAQQGVVVVSDGAYSDIITTLKTDEVGLEAPASAISKFGGQLWGNFVDDYIRATWDSLQGLAVLGLQTPDDIPIMLDVAELPVDGDAAWLSFRYQAKTVDPGEVVSGSLSGMFYNLAGALTPLGDTSANFTSAPLVGAVINWGMSGTTVQLSVTGVVAKVIQWTIYQLDSKPVVGP
jgi:hypothetical protein